MKSFKKKMKRKKKIVRDSQVEISLKVQDRLQSGKQQNKTS